MALGLGLAAIGWLLPRRIAHMKLRRHGSVLLDATGPFLGWAVLTAASARPIFAGIIVLVTFGGFAFADMAKRAALREPVVFSDSAELIELFRHPGLYLPFAGTWLVIGGSVAVALGVIAAAILDPGRWPWSPWPGLIGVGLLAGVIYAMSRPPLLDRFAQAMRDWQPVGVPVKDVEAFGPLASLLVYGGIARSERARRRAAVQPAPAVARVRGTGPSLIMIQSESFFDARRLHPAIPADLLPTFDACRRTGLQSGRFGVSGWGAYTTRAEFAALTGLPDSALGYDRFNAYHAFARVSVASLAWRLRAEGYRTICLHPFDRTYYGRDRVMPNLGFDVFLGEEAFAGAQRAGPYVRDAELARVALDLLRDAGPATFLFTMTMENHGPWLPGDSRHAGTDPAPNLPPVADAAALKCFLRGLKNADAMLGTIRDGLLASGQPALLAMYGDHLPSLPACFDELDSTEIDTDYLLWSTRPGAGLRRDLAAHQLPGILWDGLRELHSGAMTSS